MPSLNRQTLTRLFLIGLLLLSAGKLLFLHGYMIGAGYPLDYRENALVITSRLLLEGQNPYAIAQQPQSANMYGIGFSWLAWPFTLLHLDLTVTLRVVTALFIFASVLLLLLAAKKYRRLNLVSLGAILLFYYQLLYFNGAHVHPAAPGIFFSLLALYILPLRKYDTLSLLLAAGGILLAAACKLYFALLFPVIALFLFCFISIRHFLLYTSLQFSSFFLFYFLLESLQYHAYVPLVWHLQAAASSQFGHFREAFMQLLYFVLYYPFYAFLLVLATVAVFRAFQQPGPRPKIDLRKASLPLFPGLSFPFYTSGSLLTLTLFLLYLGHNRGAFLIYLIHLVSPFLVLAAIQGETVEKKSTMTRVGTVLLAFSLLIILEKPNVRFTDHSAAWQTIREKTAGFQRVMHSPLTACTDGCDPKDLYQSGHSTFCSSGLLSRTAIFNRRDRLTARVSGYEEQLRHHIEQRQYDCILTDLNENRQAMPNLVPAEYMQLFYRPADTLPAPTRTHDYYVVFWYPL